MKDMKRLAFFVIALVFAVNTVSLSAFAFSCDMDQKPVAGEQEMNCHEAEKTKDNKTQNHCEGVCFCQHVMIGQHVLLSDVVTPSAIFEKERLLPLSDQFIYLVTPAPPFRPPISIS